MTVPRVLNQWFKLKQARSVPLYFLTKITIGYRNKAGKIVVKRQFSAAALPPVQIERSALASIR